MTIEERLREVWGDDLSGDDVRMRAYDDHGNDVDDATHQYWLQQTLEHDWKTAHVKYDATTDRFAFVRSHVRRCKKTKRIIKARLMQAITSSIPYIREFAKLVAKEKPNARARQGKKKSKLGQVGEGSAHSCNSDTCSDWSR